MDRSKFKMVYIVGWPMCIYNTEELSTVDYHLNNCHCPCWLFILILKSNCRPINIVVHLKIQGRKNTTEKKSPIVYSVECILFLPVASWDIQRQRSKQSFCLSGWMGWVGPLHFRIIYPWKFLSYRKFLFQLLWILSFFTKVSVLTIGSNIWDPLHRFSYH